MSVTVPYLGMPGALRALPFLPTDVVDAPYTRGEATFALLGGGTAVARRLNAKRPSIPLPYDYLTPEESAVLVGFYDGLFGDGPFCYVDPAARNVLPLDVSTCGVRAVAPHGWAPTGGTVARDATAGPSEVQGMSGVLRWDGPGGVLTPGFDPGTAPAYVPAEPVTASLWVKNQTTTSTTLSLVGYDPAGTVVGTLTATLPVGTGWQPMSVTAGVDDDTLTGAAFVLPALSYPGTVPNSSWISAVQVEYANGPSGWLPGVGSSRVLIVSTPGNTIPQLGYSSHVLTLAEV